MVGGVSLTPTRKRVLKHWKAVKAAREGKGLTDTDPKEGTETQILAVAEPIPDVSH